MSDLNTAMIERYRNSFLKEVEAQVEQGDWVKMCMQCGVCAGSCPLGNAWEHSPQEIFMMIRAGKRWQVLKSDAMWMCTSCYNCIARCPRGLPITHIMHGLAHYATRLGLVPKDQPTEKFALMFWDNLTRTGRVNELKLAVSLYFMNGFSHGLKNLMKMKDIGLAMLKTRRMAIGNACGGHRVKDQEGLRKMLNKARELEHARIEKAGK